MSTSIAYIYKVKRLQKNEIFVGADYNLSLGLLQSRLQHINHG